MRETAPRERLREWLRATDLELIGGLLIIVLLLYAMMALGESSLVIDQQILLALRMPGDTSRGLGGPSAGFAWALVCGIVARLLQRRHVFRTRPEPDAGIDPSA